MLGYSGHKCRSFKMEVDEEHESLLIVEGMFLPTTGSWPGLGRGVPGHQRSNLERLKGRH